MAALRVNTGAIEAGNYASRVPQADWRMLVAARASFVRVHLPHDCRELLRFVEEGAEMFGALGYKTLDDFIEHGLELDPQLVEWALKGLRTIKPNEIVSFDKAIKLGKRGAPKGNRNAARKGEEKNNPDDVRIDSSAGDENKGANSTIESKRGSTSVAHTLRRLDRDGHAELATAVKAGEMTAAAARREVGYDKPKDLVTVAIKAFMRLDAKQRRRFYDEVEKLSK